MLFKLPENITARTVPQLLRDRATRYPNKLALVAESGLGGQVRLTYAQLDWLSTRLAQGLQGLGVKKGDRVAILLTNYSGAECVLTFFASHKVGAINVPVNTRFVGRELEYVLNHCEARVLVVGHEMVHVIKEIKGELDSLEAIVSVTPGESVLGLSFADVLAQGGSGGEITVEVGEDDDADLLYTSGTTGRPKGVLHTHSSTVATGIAVGGALGLKPEDVYQSAFPFFTSSGCHFNIMSVLQYGATLVMEPEFQVERTLATMERERTTVYVGVPSVYTFLLDSGLMPNYDLSSLRLLDYGGAPMPKEVIKQLYEQVPGVELRQTYGLTEAGPTGIYLPGKYALRKLGSVGKEAMPLTEFRVVDDQGRDVPPGQVGEICYRGPAIMKGYFKDPEATAAALVDGWLHSGDLVVQDEDGFLYHVDRKKDIIIRGGFNVSSMEVENILYEHPDVLEAAVVAKPHPKLGEDIKAFVVLKKGIQRTPQEIEAFCRQRLADFKVPRDIEFIDALPRNPMGKVLKTELRERVRKSSNLSGQ